MIISQNNEQRSKVQLSKIQLNKVALILAVIHWVVSFASDRLVFTYNLLDFSNLTTSVKTILAWGAKLAFLVLLIILWQFVVYLYLEYRNSNEKIKMYLRYTQIYFSIMVLFFVMLAPGLWRMDEFGILKNAVNILPVFWQGYLTSIFYIFALMLLPSPAGIIIVQIGVISLIVGYIIYKCSNLLHKKWLVYVMYIPFLLFPVIDSNFYPIRMSLYAFLELLFAFELFSIKYENREIKMKNIWLLASLAGVLICWRTEAIYYIVLAPVTFIILFYKVTSRRVKIQFTLATIIISGLLTSVQLLGNKLVSGNQYEITSVVLPITPLVYEATQNDDKQMLEPINKVLDTEILMKGYQEGKTGIAIYWSESELVKTGYSSEEFANFKSAYYKLIMKYPGVFIKERIETFVGSTGILNETENLFADDAKDYYVNFRETYHYSSPFLRSDTVKLLEFTDHEFVHNIFYSFLPQALLLIGTCLVLLIKRNWGYFFICANVCAKIPLIFLTAPSRLFMYYYSIFLVGSVLFGMMIVFIIDIRLKNIK
ncbi:MAG: hypothetical protein ACERKZ_04280 [Lachnotalea sp.]